MTETQFRWLVIGFLSSIKASLLALLFYETENGLLGVVSIVFAACGTLSFLMAFRTMWLLTAEPDEEEEPTP